MAPTRSNFAEPLARVTFPLYSLQMLTDRHFVVGGGGGSPNSGVKNGFEIFEISHDGKSFVSEHAAQHMTGPNAVMNCAVRNNGKHIYLVAGQESHCQLYNVNSKIVNSSDVTIGDQEKEDKNVRKRKNQEKKKSSESADGNSNSKQLTFSLKPNDSIQTDFTKEEPVQKCVRISPGAGKLMATGGTDGHLRVWNFPELTLKFDIAAHAKEIDDVDISPDGRYAASLSKDHVAALWNLETGKQEQTYRWTMPEGSNYMYKRCRFGLNEESANKVRLFTLTNPIGKASKLQSKLQLWGAYEADLKKSIGFAESLSALAVSEDGRFVAVGTMFSGSVSIHVAFSLQQVIHVPSAHNMFVTGLLFLPRMSTPQITETAVLSISVDNRVCIHSLPFRHTVPVWIAVVLIVVILFLVFVLCSYLGI